MQQIHENTREIDFPLSFHNRKGRRQNTALIIGMNYVLMAGGWLLVFLCWFSLPDVSGMSRIATGCFDAAFTLLTILATLKTLFFARGLWAGTWKVSINHEGIFYSYYALSSTLIRWDEITSLVSFPVNGLMHLSIGVNDEKAILKRSLRANTRNRWQYILYSILFKYDSWFLRTVCRTPSSIALSQRFLPVPIDDLIWLIQEHFSAELREYRIEVQKK